MGSIKGPCNKALDVGCGNGYWTEKLAERYENVLGIDLSDELIKIAKKKVRKSNVEFRNMNIFSLNQKDFDLIFLIEVIQHIKELKRLFLKLKNLVSKDGYIAIVEKNPHSIYAFLTSMKRRLGLTPPHFKSAKYISIKRTKEYSSRFGLLPRLIIKRKYFYGVLIKKPSIFERDCARARLTLKMLVDARASNVEKGEEGHQTP